MNASVEVESTSSLQLGPASPDPVMDDSGACAAVDGHCITCGDEGIPMRVVQADEFVAVCRDELRELHEIAVDLVAPVGAGDDVLVHAGVAIGRLDSIPTHPAPNHP